MDKTRKNGAIIGLVAETNIHVGIGQSIGALDLPVARERVTEYPFIPGSGVKGALRVWASERAGLETDDLFGPGGGAIGDSGGDGAAGKVLASDARLLLLPVRSLSSAFKWVTCPLVLDRLKRDAIRAGVNDLEFDVPKVASGHYLGDGSDNEIIGLEEREFVRAGDVPEAVLAAVKAVVPDLDVADRIAAQLVVLSDDHFAWFAKYALPVMARNALDDSKIVRPGALWYEESLPPDTIMYLVLGERVSGRLASVTAAISGENAYIQMGGNETIGQGWFKMAPVDGARSTQ